MDQKLACEQLEELLTEEVASSEKLAKILEQETQALAGGDHERLADCMREKQACLQQLRSLEAERINFCRLTGVTTDKDGMTALLKKYNSKKALETKWKKLLALTEKCRHSNELNGAAIQMRMQQISQILAVLTADSPIAKTYTIAGTASTEKAARPIAKA
ncbi:MAG: flagellar protein FlgN [Gammaproteobacteria bacterium]|nr:flagellar protein FlgN [Gammaproteobacteria bacterium]